MIITIITRRWRRRRRRRRRTTTTKANVDELSRGILIQQSRHNLKPKSQFSEKLARDNSGLAKRIIIRNQMRMRPVSRIEFYRKPFFKNGVFWSHKLRNLALRLNWWDRKTEN